MKVSVAGASGAIGTRLLPRLIAHGTRCARERARREAAPSRPVWLARLFAGDAGVMLGTEARGASNAKANRELGWTLRDPS